MSTEASTAEAAAEAANRPTSGSATYDALIRFLSAQGFLYTEEPAQGRVRFEYATEAAAWTTFAVAFEAAQQVAVYGVLPVPVGPERRAAALELLARINFGQVVGNFELNLDDGEIRFKTSLDFEGGELTFPLLRQLFAANVAMMEHYLPAILAVVLRGGEPSAALDSLGERAAS